MTTLCSAKTAGVMLAGVLAIGSSYSVHATTMTYGLSNLGGNTWEYTYTIANDSLATNIEEFTIYFDLGSYENLIVGAAPAGWYPLVVQPDPYLPDNGFYDALVSSGIAPGASLGVFTVQFDYLNPGMPGSQYYEILNPVNLDVLDSGYTQPNAVPLPPALWLFGSGLIGLIGSARARRLLATAAGKC